MLSWPTEGRVIHERHNLAQIKDLVSSSQNHVVSTSTSLGRLKAEQRGMPGRWALSAKQAQQQFW
jgi:hypothetical protein